MKNDFSALYDFINSAVKSRKYPESTAQTLRAALKLYESELNEEEKQSIGTFKQNIEQIAQGVFTKNKLKFSATSLATYKYRVQKVLNDYESYGTDPAKMASWTPKVRQSSRKSTKSTKDAPRNKDGDTEGTDTQTDLKVPSGMHKIELALRSESPPFILVLPRDIQQYEVTTITSILSSLTQHGDNGGQNTKEDER